MSKILSLLTEFGALPIIADAASQYLDMLQKSAPMHLKNHARANAHKISAREHARLW